MILPAETQYIVSLAKNIPDMSRMLVDYTGAEPGCAWGEILVHLLNKKRAIISISPFLFKL